MKTGYGFIMLCFITFLGCKKGEDDPAFTLLSRADRLKGDWHLKSAFVDAKFQDPEEGVYDYLFTADEKEFTFDVKDTVPGEQKGPFHLKLSFTKTGEMTIDESVYNTVVFNASGKWDFLGGDGEIKNKERLMLLPEIVTKGSTTVFHPLLAPDISPVYRLRELSKKQMVLVYEGKPIQRITGQTMTLRVEFIFVR